MCNRKTIRRTDHCFSVGHLPRTHASMLPFIPLCLGHVRPVETSAPPPPPGAIVIDLISEDEDSEPSSVPTPPPAAPAPPPLLPPDPTRRDGLFIAHSRVLVESGPTAGSFLGEPGLFTSEAIPAGAFVAFYTGAFFTVDELMNIPDDKLQALSRYAVEVEKHGVIVSPVADAGRDRNHINFTLHAAAAMNEPNASGEANVFAQASVVEAIGNDDELHSYVVVCIFTCSRIEAGEELLWNYGDGYQPIRDQVGYGAGSRCADELIDSLRLSSPHSRVMAILRDGRRAADALYELSLGGSDTSGEDWVPAKRRR